jgi:hypothetical protein
MGRTLLNLFKSYCTQLLKLDVVIATKNDLIGVEEVMLKSMFTQKVRLGNDFLSTDSEVFIRLIYRSELIHFPSANAIRFWTRYSQDLRSRSFCFTPYAFQIESEPILLHVASAESQKYPFEVLLRSIIKHLSDAATNEFLFIIDFFRTSPRDTFNKYVFIFD